MKGEHIDLIKAAMRRREKILDDISLVLRGDGKLRVERTLGALNGALEHATRNSPFYARRHRGGALANRVSSVEELRGFAYTTKLDLRDVYPFGLLAVPRARLVRYGESTGTTGNPTSSFMTQDDWDRDIFWATLSYMQFLGAGDMVFIAVPYELSFAAPATEAALKDLCATVVAVGALNQVCPWPRTIEMMGRLHPTVLMSTPTRALRLFDMCLAQGVAPASVGLKRLFYVGETCSEVKLRKISRRWNAELLTAYGTTETNSLSLPCSLGYQHLVEDRFLFELVDPGGDAPLTADGSRGELVLTTLRSEAMPLIRYRTGDIVEMTTAPCACGLPFARVKHCGRYAERVELSGKAILKIDLEEAILSAPGVGCYYAAGPAAGGLRAWVNVEEGFDALTVTGTIQDEILRRFGVVSEVRAAPTAAFTRAMDRMLKPGSLSLEEVEAQLERQAA